MRIAIIGAAGRVGSTVAYTLLSPEIEELLLADIIDRVEGEALDLRHAARLLNCDTKIGWTTDNSDCEGYDITIITAGVSLAAAGTGDRNVLWQKNRKIIRSIMEGLGKSIFIVTTNPVDAIATVMNDYSDSVLGIGTLTDSSRLQGSGYLIGEHAGTMVTIDGKEDPAGTVEAGRKVIAKKQGSWFATATAVAKVVKAILHDTKETLPVSIMLQGEYGLQGVCLSVPCTVGRNGVEEIIELDLQAGQKELLERAASRIRQMTE